MELRTTVTRLKSQTEKLDEVSSRARRLRLRLELNPQTGSLGHQKPLVSGF